MSTFFVCRSQAIFDASVVPDGLPKIDTGWIDQFILPTDGPDRIILNTYLGTGPLSHEVEPYASIFFDHGEDIYPTFGIPSEGPKGAALRGGSFGDHVFVPEGGVAFVVNISVAKTVTLTSWDAAVQNQLDGELFSEIQGTLGETKAVLDTIVGTYALYQYPLVWKRLYERHSYAFVDMETGATTRSFRSIRADNFVPFKLNALSHVTNDGFVDPVHGVAAPLVEAKLTEPFVFLKDSLWENDIRARFLLQFWIVEYFAEKYSTTIPVDAAAQALLLAILSLMTWQQSGMYAGIETLWATTIERNPGSFMAQYNYGLFLNQHERWDEAQLRLESAVALDPNDAAAQNNLGFAFIRQGRTYEAVNHFQKAVELQPVSPGYHANLGTALNAIGRPSEAAIQFEESLRISPNEVTVANIFAWLLATCPDSSVRNGSKAVDLAQRAIRLSGGSRAVYAGTLSVAFAEAGQFDQAVEAGEKAVSLAISEKNKPLEDRYRSLLILFHSHRPYHED